MTFTSNKKRLPSQEAFSANSDSMVDDAAGSKAGMADGNNKADNKAGDSNPAVKWLRQSARRAARRRKVLQLGRYAHLGTFSYNLLFFSLLCTMLGKTKRHGLPKSSPCLVSYLFKLIKRRSIRI